MTIAGVEPILTVDGLEVRFLDRDHMFTALSVDHLAVRTGTSLAITGPSGCGKSTLLHVLSGLLKPTLGSVTWSGRELFGMSEAQRDGWRRANVGFIFQDFELLSELSALENVLLPATFVRVSTPAPLRERARALLAELGVPDRTGPVGSFSRGERQRVALARALLFDPPVILADEPTASLDADAAARVIDLLAGLSASQGRTLITATHDPALMERLDGRLALGAQKRASQILGAET